MKKLWGVLFLFFCPLAFAVAPACVAGGKCFIVAGGTGTQTGSDWNNALSDIGVDSSGTTRAPDTNTSYFMAGGTYNRANSTSQTWSNSGVNVYKAVDCSLTAAPYCGTTTPQSVAGWQASYGTAQAKIIVPVLADQFSGAHAVMYICNSNVVFDGVTPLSGTPKIDASDYGIVIQNPNQRAQDIVISSAIGGNCVSSASQISNVTLKHLYINGVDPQYGYDIQSCTRDGTGANVTLTFAQPLQVSSGVFWVTNDKIDIRGFTGADASFNSPQSGLGLAITVNSSTSITYPQVGTANQTCTPGVGNVGSAVLNYSPAEAIMACNVASQTCNALTITDNYINAVGGAVTLINPTNVDFERNYVSSNRSTFTQHTNALVVKNGGSATGPFCNSCIVASNKFINIVGTQNFGFLSSPVVSSYLAYNNVIACGTGVGQVNTSANPQCGVSRLIGTNGSSTGGACLTSSAFVGNTFYDDGTHGTLQSSINLVANTSGSPCASVGTIFKNNMWYVPAGYSTSLNFGTTPDEANNSMLGGINGAPALSGTNDLTTAGSNPFTASGSLDFTLSLNDSTTNTGANLAAPYNVDLLGVTHPATSSWSRGAFQFVTAGNQLLTVTGLGNANGTICSDGTTCTDGIINCTITASVATGTCTHSFASGASVTLTAHATTGSFTSWSGACAGSSTCSLTMNSPFTATATFQLTPTCTLTCVSNNINSPATVSCTAALTGLSSNYLWELTEPINGTAIAACNTDGCKTGATGNLQYTGSGIYTLSAIANGVLCTASTQPLNINTGAGSAAH